MNKNMRGLDGEKVTGAFSDIDKLAVSICSIDSKTYPEEKAPTSQLGAGFLFGVISSISIHPKCIIIDPRRILIDPFQKHTAALGVFQRLH